jgi:hypothetical protein
MLATYALIGPRLAVIALNSAIFALTTRPEVHQGVTSQKIVGLNVWGWVLIGVVAIVATLGLVARQRRRRSRRLPVE